MDGRATWLTCSIWLAHCPKWKSGSVPDLPQQGSLVSRPHLITAILLTPLRASHPLQKEVENLSTPLHVPLHPLGANECFELKTECFLRLWRFSINVVSRHLLHFSLEIAPFPAVATGTEYPKRYQQLPIFPEILLTANWLIRIPVPYSSAPAICSPRILIQ